MFASGKEGVDEVHLFIAGHEDERHELDGKDSTGGRNDRE
jgi:hypothetical protein